MKRYLSAMFALLLSSAVFAQSSPSLTRQAAAPQIVEVPSGTLHRKGYFWKASGVGPVSGGAVQSWLGSRGRTTHGRPDDGRSCRRSGPGFSATWLCLFLSLPSWSRFSADQGPCTQELLKRAETKEPEASKHLRIAIVGHSFGGVLTLLSGEHDSTIRAEVTFGAGANSWRLSQELRERVLALVVKTSASIMLLHAANDYDTTAGTEIAAEFERLHKPHLLKIYPAVGKTSDDGHNLIYLAMSEWEPDVSSFLTQM
jgi:hypothetical protein